jgi:hypothetical protein
VEGREKKGLGWASMGEKREGKENGPGGGAGLHSEETEEERAGLQGRKREEKEKERVGRAQSEKEREKNAFKCI